MNPSPAYLRRELRNKKIRSLAEKKSIGEIAEEVRCSYSTVCIALKNAGIKLPRKKRTDLNSILTDWRGPVALEMRRAGKNLDEIQAVLRCRRKTLCLLLAQNGMSTVRELTDEERAGITLYRAKGYSISRYAKDTGVSSHETLLRRMRRANFTAPPRAVIIPKEIRCFYHKAKHPIECFARNRCSWHGHDTVCREGRKVLNKRYRQLRKLSRSKAGLSI